LTDKKHILKSASIISLVTIVSRILGYVREQRIALLLGTTPVADAYYLAYRIPNLFRRLVAEGSMTASFIPVFTTYMREKSKEEVWDFANKLFWTLALVVAVITVLGMVFSPQVVHLFAGKNIEGGQAVELNRIVFPYLFFIALAALAMGILNCFHVFGLPAATPVFLNLATILFTFAAVRPPGGITGGRRRNDHRSLREARPRDCPPRRGQRRHHRVEGLSNLETVAGNS